MYKLVKLSTIEKGNISGPMGPMMASKQIAKNLDIEFLGMYRVMFDHEHMYQNYDGGISLTGYDAIVLVSAQCHVFFIDQGIQCHLVTGKFSDENELIEKPKLDNMKYIKYLNEPQLLKLMKDADELLPALIKEAKDIMQEA